MTADTSSWPVISPGDIQVGDTIWVENVHGNGELSTHQGKVTGFYKTRDMVTFGNAYVDTVSNETGGRVTVRREPKPVPEYPDGTIVVIARGTNRQFAHWNATTQRWVTDWHQDGTVIDRQNPDRVRVVEVVRTLPDGYIAIPKTWTVLLERDYSDELGRRGFYVAQKIVASVIAVLDAEAKS